MSEEFGFYTTELILRPSCYMHSDLEPFEPVAANDSDRGNDDCEAFTLCSVSNYLR